MKKVIVDDPNAIKWDGKNVYTLEPGVYLAQHHLALGVLLVAETPRAVIDYVHFVTIAGTTFKSFSPDSLRILGKLDVQDFEVLKNGN